MECTQEELNILIEKFHFHVGLKNDENECWPWLGLFSGSDYGQLYAFKKQWPVHRLSYMLHKGEIPEGFLVRHTCDNPRCVNPKHLELGTHVENALDYAERCSLSERKLNSECVKVIKYLIKENKKKMVSNKKLVQKLAKFHKVSCPTISNIIRGKTWAWVEC